MNDQFLAKLIEQEYLTENVGKRLVEDASFSGKKIEDLIYERRLVNEEDVAMIKSSLSGVPYKKIDPKTISEQVLALLPEETISNYKTIRIFHWLFIWMDNF